MLNQMQAVFVYIADYTRNMRLHLHNLDNLTRYIKGYIIFSKAIKVGSGSLI